MKIHVYNYPDDDWAELNVGYPIEETFCLSEILRAAIVAGYPSKKNIPSQQFAKWRAAALHMGLRTQGRDLVRPPEWVHLDPSEKGAIRSLLGVTVAKLLSERLLGAPTFLFLDVHFTYTPTGGDRPDFIAMTPDGRWFSIEAKGRERFRLATLEKGKAQAEAIGTVNGDDVEAHIVCVTSFSGGVIEARFVDPEARKEKPIAITREPIEMFYDYYEGLFQFSKFSENIPFDGKMREHQIPSNQEILVWKNQDLDVEFGILSDLKIALEERSIKKIRSILKGLGNETREDTFLGPDGIYVFPGPSWKHNSFQG